MSYTKTTWQNGDVITAEKLNKLENGVAVMIAETVDGNTHTLNKTWAEISNMVGAGLPYLMNQIGFIQPLIAIGGEDTYSVAFGSLGDMTEYTADSVDGYPSYTVDNSET